MTKKEVHTTRAGADFRFEGWESTGSSRTFRTRPDPQLHHAVWALDQAVRCCGLLSAGMTGL